MESFAILLFSVLFAAVPVLALVVAVELFSLTRLIRRDYPELYHRFSGYGSYPGSTHHNVVLFVFGPGSDPGSDASRGGERLAKRCRRARSLTWTMMATMFGGGLLVMSLGS